MKTLVDLLRDRVQAQPEKVVYQYWQDGGISDSLSFSGLERRARATAAQLLNIVPAGERVVLLFPQSLDPIVGFYACLLSGMVAVPIPVPFMGEVSNRLAVLKRYLDDAGAQTILTVSTVSSVLQPGAAEAGLGNVRWVNMEAVDLSAAESWKQPIITADMPALMLYTSGSTQLPRGVIARQGNIIAFLDDLAGNYKDWKDIYVGWTPMQNAMSFLFFINVLRLDSTQIWFSTQAFIQKPITWLKLISDFRATRSIGPNFAYRLCVVGIKPEEREGLDLSSWKCAITGGEPVQMGVLDQFSRVYEAYGFSAKAFVPAYGSSELLGGSLIEFGRGFKVIWANRVALEQRRLIESPADSNEAKPFISCGKLNPSYHRIIVDPDTLEPCTPDQIGELWVAGPAIAQGYWNKPAETAETFNAHLANGEGPFFRTGDLCFIKDGELYVVGRIKDIMIVNGRNLSAIDFELLAGGAHPSLQPGMAAAFGVSVEGEEKVVIMHETRPEQEDVDVEEVARQIRRVVFDELNVSLYGVVLVKPGSLPRTGSGKIQRYLCRNRYLESLSDKYKKK